MEMNVCRIINAYIQSGRIANPTERNIRKALPDMEDLRKLLSEKKKEV